MTKTTKANIFGVIAIALWSASALFVAKSGTTPPFLIGALTGIICTFFYLIRAAFIKEGLKSFFNINLKNCIIPILGIFFYFSCYLIAFKNAPALEVNLLNYLWPLLIVFLGAFVFKNGEFKTLDAVGMTLGFLGASLIFGADFLNQNMTSQVFFGYTLATLAAIIWASYSNLTKMSPNEPNDMGGIYFMTGLLFLTCHFIFEDPSLQALFDLELSYWVAIIFLSFSNLGYACWDFAMKHGQVPLLASLSYCIPLFSTLLLLIFHEQVITGSLTSSALLIISACLIVNAKTIKKIILRNNYEH